MDGFEETYGSGSMKNFVQVLHQVDDMEKRKDIWFGSINISIYHYYCKCITPRCIINSMMSQTDWLAIQGTNC